MGRPERPIDPDGGPVAEFAFALRKLRDEAGRPSYRELARRASFSVTVLSEAAGGRSLPTLAVVRGYVRACGGDVGEWEERWRRAAARQQEDSAGSAPYLGLASYGVEHSGLFFGREALTADLLRRLAERRFLAVFGPSGSGKSSLLRAGLLAAVRRGAAPDWTAIVLTPGEQPVSALAGQLAALTGREAAAAHEELLAEPAALHAAAERALAGRPPGAELLCVVDQFEELFTVCGDPGQRDRFVRALLAAVTADGSRTRVVLGVRADFYAQCAAWPELVAALCDAQVLVGPIGPDQLRDVIVKPAEQAGMAVEAALVATALAETGTEPGALALLSHALLETWRHSPPGRMTLAAYTEAGGVPHAVASTAEQVYAGCGEGERQILRRIFLRLVAIGDGTPDARRRVPPGELPAGPGPAAALVEKLARARLVTIDDGSVQLAHEALIRFWPRLAGWLAEGRDDLRVQRRLSEAAAEWAGTGRDPALLYRGTPLEAARTWAGRDGGLAGLTPAEREFLDASGAAEAAGQAAALRVTRRLRRLVAALTVLLGAVSAVSVIAVWQRQAELSAEHAAVSGQLAASSSSLASVNSGAAVLAALAAWHADRTVAARSALLSTAACCVSTQTSLPGDKAAVDAVALGPGGRLLAAGGYDKVVHLWDTASGRQLPVLRGPAGAIGAIAVSPRGDIVAAGSADRAIWLWNTARGTRLRVPAGTPGAVEAIAFSPDGTLLASAQGQVRLWDPATGRPEATLRTPGEQMRAVAFCPDGRTLAAAGSDGTVMLWADPAHVSAAQRLTGAGSPVGNLACGPGGMIAAEERSGDVLLWRQGQHAPVLLPRATARSRGLAFSRDGSVLLTGGNYNSVMLWNTRTGQLIASLARKSPVYGRALAYSPDGGTLAIGGAAGAVQIWRDPVAPFTGSAQVAGLAIVQGGAAIASAGGGRTLFLWNRDGRLITAGTLPAVPAAIAASPDGKLLATAGGDGTVAIRDLPGLAIRRQWHTGAPATDVAFSPDGRLLAAAAGATVTVWDTGSGARRLAFPVGRGAFEGIAFSPRGDALAAVTNRGNVMIWDTRTGRPAAQENAGPGALRAVAFSPAGTLLATAGNEGNITFWNPSGLHRLAVLASVGSVQALAFSPGGRVLASAEENGTILLWDTASRSVDATLTGSPPRSVQAVAFTGGTLFTGDKSGRIIAWDLDPDDMARRDCQVLARDPGLRQAETLVPQASYPRLCPAGAG